MPTGGQGYNTEFSTGDITDKDGNSLVYVPASDTAPTHNLDGLLWYNSDEGRIYIKYDGQWVDASPTVIPPLVEPTRLLNGEYELDLNQDGILSFGTVGSSAGLQINGDGADRSLGYPTLLNLTQDTEHPNALTIRNRLAGLDKGLAIYVDDQGQPTFTKGTDASLNLVFTKDNLLKIEPNGDKANIVIGEVRDGDAVIWAQPKQSGNTEYLGLWWAGNTDVQSGYGPDAAITIGTDNPDDMNDSIDVDPNTQIGLAIGDQRWKFAYDGTLEIPGHGWERETTGDIFSAKSIFINGQGTATRIQWGDINIWGLLSDGQAAFVRTEQSTEGYDIHVGEKYSSGVNYRNWTFKPNGVLAVSYTHLTLPTKA